MEQQESEQLDPELVARIIESARRNPIDARLPPKLWARLAQLRLEFDGEVHAVSCLQGHRAAIVLLVPTARPSAPPVGDWRRIDEPQFVMIEADRGGRMH